MSVKSDQVAAEPVSRDKPPEPTGRRNMLDPGQGRRGWLLIVPTLVTLTIVIVYPVFRAVYQSFQQDEMIDPQSGMFVTGGFAGIDNYTHWILQRCGDVSCPTGNNAASFYTSVWITVMFTVITVILETILGLWFAMIMNKNIRGRGLLRAAILIPWAIPTAVTAKLWYFIFAYEGIANSLAHVNILWTGSQWPARMAIIVADTWKTTPFMALLILAGLQLISTEVYESAKVDGASAWQRFTHITLPLVRPALMVAVLFRTLDVLRMYDLPAILTQGSNGTTTLSILVVDELHGAPNSAAALSTITFLFIFFIAFVFIKFLGANVTDDDPAQRKGK